MCSMVDITSIREMTLKISKKLKQSKEFKIYTDITANDEASNKGVSNIVYIRYICVAHLHLTRIQQVFELFSCNFADFAIVSLPCY